MWFRHVSYHIRNQHEPEYVWHWNARRGRLPDQYQLDHVLEISANPPADPVAYSEGQRGEASSGVPDNATRHGWSCPTAASTSSTTPTMAIRLPSATCTAPC